MLSNGVLRERTELPDERVRWHYALDFPHPAYLVTLVAGPFAEIADARPAAPASTSTTSCRPGARTDARARSGARPT